jgi:long-chain acyl-CoA synthetase
MVEEKNSLLGYLLCTPEEEKRVFVREMDERQNIHDYTFKDLLCSSFSLGRFLQNEGETWGQYVPLFLETSYEFLQTFFATLMAQKVCVPLHSTLNEDTLGFCLRKIQARCIVVTQPWLYRKLVKVDYVHKHIHTIFASPEVIAEKALPSRHINLCEILSQPQTVEDAKEHLSKVLASTKSDDPMQVVFTSGTTGEPKGAMLSHRNVVSCVCRAANHLKIDSGYRTLTFLPLSHVMGQNEVFIALTTRALVQIVSRDNLLHGLKTFKPNILVSVPRVYQAIHQGIQKKLRAKPVARKLVDFCVRVHAKGKRAAWPQRLLAALFTKTAGRLITHKIRQGLGDFLLTVTAGAACPEHIYDFFEAVGRPLTNAQGLTEVSGAIIYNRPNETLRGSIGYPLPGVEVRIDEDGEILMKGDPVFCGYFEEPEANKLAFTADGFFRTGDMGKMEMLHGKPYIFLEGRKKEIVVLATGENIPPVQIEEKLLQYDHLIYQAVVVGDGKPRLGALIVPNTGQYSNANMRAEIAKVIHEVNKQMDVNEKIGGFEILPEPLTVENGMLTPTLKVRRLVVFQRYKELIGQLYNTLSA